MSDSANPFIKYTILSCFLWLSLFEQGYARSQKSDAVLSLKNNKYISIQACTDQIFRIRVSSKQDFPETLMERYGILKTDWPSIKVTSKTEKENRLFQTSKFQLAVNEGTGELSVMDSNGNLVISNIRILQEGEKSVCKNLSQSLEQYFGKEKQDGAIIGDASYKGKPSDSVTTGLNLLPSVMEVSLLANERFYGGGSTSRKNIQHRGEALRMWATYQKTEIPTPFLVSSNGWGILNNSTSLNYFDIGRFQKDKMFIYNTNGDVDFYLCMDNSMNGAINLYTEITGKPYLLPKWAYGLAFGGNMKEDQFGLMNDAVRFRDEKIPCDIFWIEPQWMAKNYDFSTSKDWDLSKFPAEAFWEVEKFPKYENKTLFVSKLHKLGFKLALWLCIDNDLSIEEEDQVAEKSGKPQSGKERWFAHLTRFMDQGVDGFKLDPGRTLDEHPDRKYYNGFTDKEMHNLNQVLLPKQMYQIFREHKGIRSFHHYCGGYAGTQHWGASTSGDNGGGKNALFDQLNLGLSGFMNTSADVLEGVDDNKAGIHLGFFLPWVQINSWYSLHHPWYLPPVEKETFSFYAQLRNSLSPYIYSAALQGSQTGMPILRAMPLVFPDDRNVDNMIYQFMFGENLLVGAFCDSVYLPKGSWIDYWTGEKFSGGKTVHCNIPATRGGPLFIKAGAIIPYQKPMQYIGEFPTDTLIMRVYPEKQSFYTLMEDDGKSFDFEKGNIAKTQFECNETDRKTDFTIFPVEGKYAGMFTSRNFQLEINSSKKPIKVMVNGNKSENWKYNSSGKVLICVSQKKVSEKQVIELFKNE